MSEVGREIRRIREEREWSQLELAFRSGLSPASVNLIEAGKRNATANTLQKIARGFGLTVGDLFPKDQMSFDLEEEDEALVRDLLQRVKADEMGISEALDAMRDAGLIQKRPRTPARTERAREAV